MFSLSPFRIAAYLLVISLGMGPLSFCTPCYCQGPLGDAVGILLLLAIVMAFIPPVTKPQRKQVLGSALAVFFTWNLIFIHY